MEDSSGGRNSKIFSSQEFMEFLAKQVDISKLEVVTKSGDRISASFNGMVSASGDDSIFKSLDSLKSLDSIDSVKSGVQPTATVSLELSKAPSSNPPSSAANPFTSKEWGKPPSVASAPVALPPKKRAGKDKDKGKTDWYGMYADALSPLVEAAALAQPHPLEGTDEDSKKLAGKDTKSLQKPSKRKPRKIIPENKDYVDVYTDFDVLFGRGGRSNHHPGNKIYRDMVTDLQPHYRNCDKNEKTKVAQRIVDCINNEHNGRFLELEKGTNRWYIVPNIVARRKVGQALRENNTEEARAAKRHKYGPVKKPQQQQVVQAAAV